MENVAKIIETSTYTLRDENGDDTEIEAIDLADAKQQARDWVAGGSWGEIESTIWVDVLIFDTDGDRVDRVKVALNLDEPECECTDHDWQSPIDLVGGIKENPGVWGHGGGVIITECCMHCGCKRVTDTWAQDTSTGEQGLTSVSYEPDAYDVSKSGESSE